MTVDRARAGVVLLSCVLCACAPLRPRPPAAAVPPAASVPDLAAAIAADAERSDREPDAKVREQLAADALRDADACLAAAPQAAACLYYHAIAQGLQARAHPTQALDLLKRMLDGLAAADAVDPAYDEAGPARVRALVLLRAPGWPLGPGDADAAATAARRAVELKPRYPPNLLALAEARSKTGDAAAARDAFTQARDLARALPPSAARDAWLKQAAEALAKP